MGQREIIRHLAKMLNEILINFFFALHCEIEEVVAVSRFKLNPDLLAIFRVDCANRKSFD